MSELPHHYVENKEKLRMVLEISDKLIDQMEQFVEDIRRHPTPKEWNNLYQGFKVKLKPIRETLDRAKRWYDSLL